MGGLGYAGVMSTDLYQIPVHRIDGSRTSLAEYRGKVLLVVNVASKCGLTAQYEGLERLYREFRGSGLEVLGFPANDFSGQEPGSNEEISQFCRTNFSVDFPMFSKVEVTGPAKHPLYAALTAAKPSSTGNGKQEFIDGLIRFGAQPNAEPDLLWNFEKFLVGRSGEVVARFSPNTLPDAPELKQAIEAELTRS